jgi:hypothetical protein
VQYGQHPRVIDGGQLLLAEAVFLACAPHGRDFVVQGRLICDPGVSLKLLPSVVCVFRRPRRGLLVARLHFLDAALADGVQSIDGRLVVLLGLARRLRIASVKIIPIGLLRQKGRIFLLMVLQLLDVLVAQL